MAEMEGGLKTKWLVYMVCSAFLNRFIMIGGNIAITGKV